MLLAGPSSSTGVRQTYQLDPAGAVIEEAGSATCYYRSRFINRDRSRGTQQVTVLRSPDAAALSQDLSHSAIFYNDIREAVSAGTLSLNDILFSNLAVLFIEMYGVAADATDDEISRTYSGVSYPVYSLSDSEDNYLYAFVKDGKERYSDAPVAALACVVPSEWLTSSDQEAQLGRGSLANGTALEITPELSMFEDSTWGSIWYKIFFRWVFSFQFFVVGAGCTFWLWRYSQHCTKQEIRKIFLTPVLCLCLNLISSFTMAFIFFVDGWGSLGFLTAETFSGFLTLTRMTALGSVWLMGMHWMQLRKSISAFNKGGTVRDKDLKQGEERVPFLNKRTAHIAKKAPIVVLCMLDVILFVFVKTMRQSLDSVWLPLLFGIALLELASVLFFTNQSRLFARDVKYVVAAAKMNNTANVRFLNRMLRYMNLCSMFLLLSVICSFCLGAIKFRENAKAWNLAWGFSISARLGIGACISFSCRLNTNGRRRIAPKEGGQTSSNPPASPNSGPKVFQLASSPQ